MMLLATLAPGPVQAQDNSQQMKDRPADFGSAVATPAEDLNLRKTAIPDILQRAATNPYDLRDLERCPAVATEVQRLDAVLGPDLDATPVADTRSTGQKRKTTAASVLKTGVEAVTPYRGLIRRLTGASAYADKVQDAIEAGFARRGYLKGMAMKMNCAPPASPAWFKPAVASRTRPSAARR